ncbi:uncharacterized protein LOC141644343 [Silene latifolia]|uniref:uncharacterized protein LOC141644343 n=1 Tax=Silene latifolia TaxID=37657 RepID=UPI003D7757B3
MANRVFPLCWESTGDQWWYATPIDWASANGMCDLVTELLRIDPNLLIKLTSLRRIRRLETVWEDDLGMGTEARNRVARCRAKVARSLLLDCEPKTGNVDQQNSLIRAGYGGWLLYTASSAGDVDFVKDLLERDPLAVFGEGEYGITDILYAAARSRNSEVFRLLLEYAMDVNKGSSDADENFVEEMMIRAVHAAARGGNLEILKDLLLECSDVSCYRDAQGYTILHSAAGRGQVEVVNHLIRTYNIVDMSDNQGNTALHVAAYKGYSSVVENLILASPLLATSRNNNGDTFLHMVVVGFRAPHFHRIDQQMELMKQVLNNRVVTLKDLINITNNEGKTALHVAIAENVPFNVVDLLMGDPSMDLNIRDLDGSTPLDLLKHRPKTTIPETLNKQIASAGGGCNDLNNASRSSTCGGLLKIQGIGTSPGTSFRFPDGELLSCTGDGFDSDISCELPSSRFSSCSSEQTPTHFNLSNGMKKSGSTNSGSNRLKSLLQWSRGKPGTKLATMSRNVDDKPVSLRQRFSKMNGFPTPSAREKFAASLTHGVIQAKHSPSTPYLESLGSSPTSVNKSRTGSKFYSGPLNGGRSMTDDKHRRVSSFSKSLMNQYFCFGAQGLAVEPVQPEDPVSYKSVNRSCRRLVF